MPDDYRISDLTTIGTVGNDDLVEVSAVNGASETGFSSFKMPMTKLGDKVVNGIQYASDLQTTSKTIVGAINELAQGGNVGSLDDLDDVDISSPENEQVLKYNSASRKWVNGQGIEIIKSASGNPCSFETRFPGKLKSLTAQIVASGGNGTPQQENPIVGYSEVNFKRCGKNFFDIDWLNDVGATRATISVSGESVTVTATGNDGYTNYNVQLWSEEKRIKVKEGDVVRLRWNVSGASGLCGIFGNGSTSSYKTEQNSTGLVTYTVPSGVTFVTVRFGVANSGESATYSNLMVTINDETVTFEPYNSQLITLSLGQTVYGGRLYFENGWKCDVTWGMKDLGDLDWYYISAADHERFRCTSDLSDMKEFAINVVTTAKCEIFKAATYNNVYGHSEDNIFSIAYGNEKLLVYASAFTDAITFKAAVDGYKLIYELATPFTIDLSSSDMLDAVVGKNNVFSDCGGDVEVEYYTDIAGDIKEFIKDNIEITDIVKELVDTLEAGETTLTFTDPAITTNSTIKVYENVGAFSDIVMYSDIVVTTGQIVITFPVQSTDLQVKVRIS